MTQNSNVSNQCRNTWDQAMPSSTSLYITTPPSWEEGRKDTALWAVFLATHNTRLSKKLWRDANPQIPLAQSFLPISARTWDDTSAWNRSYRAGTRDWCNANTVYLQPNDSLQLYPFISGGYTAQSMASSWTGGSEVEQNALLSIWKIHLAQPWILSF